MVKSRLDFRIFGKLLMWLFVLLFSNVFLFSQENFSELYIAHLKSLDQKYAESDLKDILITNQHVSQRSQVVHTYLQQHLNGIPVKGGVMSIHTLQDGTLAKINDQFYVGIGEIIKKYEPALDVLEAVRRMSDEMHYSLKEDLKILTAKKAASHSYILTDGGISSEDIPVKLVYFPLNDSSFRLSWEMLIHRPEAAEWWQIIIDAENGDMLDKTNLYISCDFGSITHQHNDCMHTHDKFEQKYQTDLEDYTQSDNASYRVYPLGVESPAHGDRVLIVNPADATASPYGWHDTDGMPGAEHTTTKGNNVEAREDKDGDNNTLGAMAQGGAGLVFDFPIDLNLAPSASQDAAITNLFYWNNIMHDIWYQYGFDESAGNFQQNNYGKGGFGSDFVRADALDGNGINNANFATPVDGFHPRMQMYLWSRHLNSFVVNHPASVAGNYSMVNATFGPQVFTLAGQVVMVDDGSSSPTSGCNALVNGAALSGKIAMVDRGNCEFGTKCLNAQNAGAVAVIVCNNVANAPIAMGAGQVGHLVDIPSLMISQNACDILRLQIATLQVTITSTDGVQIDGDYDNGIIAHEYGHGISNRLTGGASNSNCLSNQEQMGEGWSDWFGLMLTIKSGDTKVTPRGIGTYALGQTPLGNGIRLYSYTTDLSVNPHTYTNISSVSVPHGVGSVWCAMLWELTWLLIDEYGYDPDLYYGTGGNNMAMAIVTEALKLQPCSPGFVDGRNAIILADQILYGGENQCLIWQAFAKRGLGYSANQGVASSVSDGTEAFDMPDSCCKFVTNTNNSGSQSLRSAISCAASGDIIKFSSSLHDQIIDITSPVSLNKNLTLMHKDAGKIIIRSLNDSPVFIVNEGISIMLEKVNIIAGSALQGRALINYGSLVLSDVQITDAQLPNNTGSTIQNNGSIQLMGSTSISKQ